MRWVGFGLALVVSSPALAAPMVSAEKPQSVAEALEGAGHEVTLGTDDLGDPVLELGLRGYKARLLFMDCDAASHDRCRSLQFVAGFDAEGTGLSAADAVAFAARHRYAAVTLNAAGDPTLRWDVETGEGIPRSVLVTAAERFLGTVQAMGAMLYPPPTG